MTVPGRLEAARLLCSLDPPPWFLAHACAVADVASWLARSALELGHPVNVTAVETAALLHDVDKLLPAGDPAARLPHGEGSAAWLVRRGHPELAPLVRDHPVTRLADPATAAALLAGPVEARILAYADKRAGQRLESMDARFASWRRRYPAGAGPDGGGWEDALARGDPRPGARPRGRRVRARRHLARRRPAPPLVPPRPGAGPAAGGGGMTAESPALAYLRGDDDWALDRAARAVGDRLEAAAGGRPERWRVGGQETTAAAITERVATGTLFGGGTLAVVVDPAPLLRSKADREALAVAVRAVAPGNGLVFLETGDGSRRSAALTALEGAVRDAGGETRELRAPRADQLTGWVEARARELGVRLGPGAAKELARRVGGFVREGDVDRRGQGALAVAELEKLGLYRTDGAGHGGRRPGPRARGRPRLDVGPARRDRRAPGGRRRPAARPAARAHPGARGPGPAAPADPRPARGRRPPRCRRRPGLARADARAQAVPGREARRARPAAGGWTSWSGRWRASSTSTRR